MTPVPTVDNRKILFGVTSSQSLKLLGDIPRTMSRFDWDVHVVSGDNSSAIPRALRGIKLHSIPMVRNPSPTRDAIALVRWILLLRRLKPEIVVIGTPKAALLGLIASFLCRVPTRIYHLRGLRLQTVTGVRKRLLYTAELLTAKASSSILAVSHSLKREYSRLGLSHETKITVLGLGSSHGVNTAKFNRSRWKDFKPREALLKRSMKTKTPIIGFVGRFSTDKGAEELIHCKRRLLDSNIRHTLLVIGPTEDNQEALDQLRNMGEGTVIAGSVDDVAPYYSILSLLLLPTHREGLPNAVLEAASSGVPSITTDVTGAIDSVVDGETGTIVAGGDPEAFASAVVDLLARPQSIVKMGIKARQRVLSDFDSKVVAKNHVTYFVECVESSCSDK